MCIGFFTLVGACLLCMRIYTYSNITWHVQPFPNHVTSHNLAAIVCVWYMYMHGCRVMRMDPNFSTTLLNLLSSVLGADSLPQKFPLLFSNSQNPMSQQQASHDSSLETPQGNCTTKVGTQVNVITGGSSGTIGQLNVKSPGAVVSHASKESDMIDIPIKVVNPTNKRESKTYMLSLQLEKMASLTCMYWNSWGKVLLALVYSLMWDTFLASIKFVLLKLISEGIPKYSTNCGQRHWTLGNTKVRKNPHVVQSGVIRSQQKMPKKILTVVLIGWHQPLHIWPIP